MKKMQIGDVVFERCNDKKIYSKILSIKNGFAILVTLDNDIGTYQIPEKYLQYFEIDENYKF